MAKPMFSSLVVAVRRACLAAGMMAIAATTGHAQPGNLGPANFVDVGDVGIGQTTHRTATVTAGGYVWFRIRLTETIDPRANWMELDMSGPTTLTDPEMALYDASANRLFVNDNSGGSCGAAGNELAPALSIGGGSGLRLSRTQGTNWNGGRISTGSDGQSLAAGTYWVCVTAWDGAFVDPNPNWTASTTSVLSGTIGLTVTTGPVAAATWNEAQRSTDAGEFLDTAQVVTGSGPLTNILTSYNVSSRDMFKIRICDGATFRAVAAVSGIDGLRYQTRLFLFDAAGRGVYAIAGTTSNSDTTLTRPAGAPPFPAGEYYLAISSNCGGFITGGTDYGPAVPFTAANEVMWAFTTTNVPIPPTTAGAALPLSYWGRQADCQNPGAYYANITLTGACFIEPGPAPCVADVDNGTSTGTPDGGVNIDDLLYFLERFTQGC